MIASDRLHGAIGAENHMGQIMRLPRAVARHLEYPVCFHVYPETGKVFHDGNG